MTDKFDNSENDFLGDIQADEETLREVELAARNKKPPRERYRPPKKPNYSQARRKKLRNLKILLAVSWILLIALIGAAGYMVWDEANDIKEAAPRMSDGVTVQPFDEVALVALNDDVAKSGRMFFALIRINSQNSECSVSVLPERLNMAVGNKSATLAEQYEYGGIFQVKRAINEFSGINIDKCLDGDFSDIEKILEKIGTVEYNIDKAMKETDSAGSVYCNLEAGTQSLTPQQIFSFLRYRGERTVSEESSQCSALAAAVLSQMWTQDVKDSLPSLYEHMVNLVQTDISTADINELIDCFDGFSGKNAVAVGITAAGDQPVIDSESKDALIRSFK